MPAGFLTVDRGQRTSHDTHESQNAHSTSSGGRAKKGRAEERTTQRAERLLEKKNPTSGALCSRSTSSPRFSMSWTATTRSGAPHKLDGDVASFAALLGRLAARDGGLSDEEAAAAELFDWTAPLHVARSPGRLDVMGGIADYSGSRVLQMPIGEACLVAAQRQPASAGVRAASFGSAAGGRTSVVHVALSELAGPAGPVPLAELRTRLNQY